MNSINDLEGKTILAYSQGGTPDIILQQILKENGVIYFFINETFVYKEFAIAQKHNSFGFFMSPQSTLSVEDAKVYINESNRTMTKGVVMCPFESVELNRLSTK